MTLVGWNGGLGFRRLSAPGYCYDLSVYHSYEVVPAFPALSVLKSLCVVACALVSCHVAAFADRATQF